jgi:hypothetical protein
LRLIEGKNRQCGGHYLATAGTNHQNATAVRHSRFETDLFRLSLDTATPASSPTRRLSAFSTGFIIFSDRRRHLEKRMERDAGANEL